MLIAEQIKRVILTIIFFFFNFASICILGHARADEIIVNAFMTVFAYFFGEYKQYMPIKNTRTGMRELQVRLD